MDVELQILCFSSPRPCASSPGLHVHLDLALLVLLLAQFLVFLMFLRCSWWEEGKVAERMVVAVDGMDEVDGWEWNGWVGGCCGGVVAL